MSARILVVDDEASIREFFKIMLEKEGYKITCAQDGQEALTILEKKSFDMVISDLQMPNLTGIELLKEVKDQMPDMIFLMVTAFGTTDTAVEAMKLGAYDYITKPFRIDEVRINIAQALRSKDLESENRNLRKVLGAEYSFQNLIGDSEVMHSVFEIIKRVSQASANILITGESGTGKEMIAKAIHFNGPLKGKPFISVNCGAIPEMLMESEMFGHKRGSFTGAVTDKVGLFEAAGGGTLFLDEVGELPPGIQVKFLRAIQEKIIRRVGCIKDVSIDIRIITATNRDLGEMVSQQSFRQDLYYRLNVINIEAPSLRSRKEDIPLLAKHFVDKHSNHSGKSIKDITRSALDILSEYNYPGNVRELENIIERAIALEPGSSILPESLPAMVNSSSGGKTLKSAYNIEVSEDGVDLEKIMGQVERELLIKAIDLSNGIKKRAAKFLNISFRSMRYRIEKYNLASSDEDESETASGFKRAQ